MRKDETREAATLKEAKKHFPSSRSMLDRISREEYAKRAEWHVLDGFHHVLGGNVGLGMYFVRQAGAIVGCIGFATKTAVAEANRVWKPAIS